VGPAELIRSRSWARRTSACVFRPHLSTDFGVRSPIELLNHIGAKKPTALEIVPCETSYDCAKPGSPAQNFLETGLRIALGSSDREFRELMEVVADVSNWRCAERDSRCTDIPPAKAEDSLECLTGLSAGPECTDTPGTKKERVCRLPLPAKRLNVYPDFLELVFWDPGDWPRPVASQPSTLPPDLQDLPEPTGATPPMALAIALKALMALPPELVGGPNVSQQIADGYHKICTPARTGTFVAPFGRGRIALSPGGPPTGVEDDYRPVDATRPIAPWSGGEPYVGWA
jgi:hypothetical protein